MKTGFFSKSDIEHLNSQASVQSIYPECGSCGLHKHCKSPKLPVQGKGKKKIMLVVNAATSEDDKHGSLLASEAGQFLVDTLCSMGIDVDEDCWVTAALTCNPKHGSVDLKKIGKNLKYCRPNLRNAIADHKPRVVIVLGDWAMQSIVDLIWKADGNYEAARWTGWTIPSRNINAWVCPTFDLHYVWKLAQKKEKQERNEEIEDWLRGDPLVVGRMFRKHLKAAIKKKELPPLIINPVEKIFEPRATVRAIRDMIDEGGIAAFDYETNSLKPVWPKSQIVSCAICHRGERTIAFPWNHKVEEAMIEWLTSKRIIKIGAKISFEQWWTLRKLGVSVKNFNYDTVLCAHWLDYRDRTASVKFQSLVRLGVGAYDESIKPYLESSKGSPYNRIRQLQLSDLLLYNGLDAEYEYRLAELQCQEAGIPFNNH